MESVVLITDRPELRQTLRRALGAAPAFCACTPDEWRRRAFGATRGRVFVLDLAGPSPARELLAVAERWPSGFSGMVLAVLPGAEAAAFNPRPYVHDFLVEPFSDAEANLRIRNLLWRATAEMSSHTLAYGGLRIDRERHEVTRDGAVLDLAFKEYELLSFLAAHPGRVFTRDDLLRRVWGEDYYGGARTVDVHIRRLRVKLGIAYESCIVTVRNVGYRFQWDVE